MVLTILEAAVQPERWETLTRAYHDDTREIPDFIVQSYLIQSQAESTTWRIITVWRSQADLDALRNSGETPTGVLIFQAAGATPVLSIFDVAKTVR